MDAGVVE